MNNGAWSEEHQRYVLENINKLPFAEICEYVGRSENAVKLFLHRKKIPIGETVKRNLVKELLAIKFVKPEYFNPTRSFYKAVNITQMRWWDLYYGRKQITQTEYISIAKHLKVSLEDAFEARQLNLFTDNED